MRPRLVILISLAFASFDIRSPAAEPKKDWPFQTSDPVPASVLGLNGTPTRVITEERDPWLWPFSSSSIWNIPVGSAAKYVHAGIGPAKNTRGDLEILHRVAPGSPERPVYDPGRSGGARATGTTVRSKSRRQAIPIEDNFVVPDIKPGLTPNACAALLLPDAKTVVNIGPLCRPEAGGPIWGWMEKKVEVDLYGDGILGSHGGSALSTLGGSIRPGEMLGLRPLHHVIKLNLWAKLYYSYTNDGTPGYRWPAVKADTGAKDRYLGHNPEMEIGALLAIPANVNVASGHLHTKQGRILFQTLQDYGAYLVDDSAWDSHDFCVDQDADKEMLEKLKFSFSHPSREFSADINSLVQLLSVIANNGPQSIGGGGTPRVALAPPLKAPTQ